MAKMIFNERYFDELLKSSRVDGLVSRIADGIATDARASAPVDTGAYRSGIVRRKKTSAHRVVHLVVASDPKSLIIEARTGNLVRALRKRKR